ncbi:Uncharacterised protein [Salmonella enterica subsp. enterica serovar Bovismorbificans]|uniref:Uncharacterized protein n=1 Tax=Salmonella enterica subsp. enterica serovar Bovismorbificans TaxID=58097 RepID=A0A655C5F7_SALET|nr:Uncharacterised protein [Salmonella enterica subsp. enterica serovar Bovismorbificans]
MNKQRLVFGGSFQFVVGLDLPAVDAIFNCALRSAYVGAVDRFADLIQRDALVKERLRV